MSEFREVAVYVRLGDDERALWVEIDPSARREELLPQLLKALKLPGDPAAYVLTNEGSFDEPELIVSRVEARVVGSVRSMDAKGPS